MEPLKIKVKNTELSIPNGVLIVIVIAIVFGILILFGGLEPIDAYLWILKILKDVKDIFN